MQFSKSKYTTGIQCPKALWLQEYRPEVLSPSNTAALARLEIGKTVGALACGLFTPGVKIPYSATHSYQSMIDQTKQLIQNGTEYIYEATFLFEGVLIMVDILRNTTEGIEIFEVKSSSDTKAIKDIFFHDIAIQKYTLTNLGFNVLDSYLVHLNHDYVRGEELDLSSLFTIVNVSSEIEQLQQNIPLDLQSLQASLDNEVEEPETDIGKHCKHPYTCSAKEYCWKTQRGIPDYSLFNIFNIGSKKQLDLYSKGIVDIGDIPSDYPMTEKQEQKVFNYKNQVTHIDKLEIRAFLDTLSYPIYHLDFETFQQPVPEWEGISPYQQIPFQYSLHIQHQDGTIEHKEFLAVEGADPRQELTERLVGDIPNNVTVLTYNMSFEKGVISKLAQQNTRLSEHLLAINSNIYDLMIPFQQKYYVTPQMNGSYSIKYVLPALVPHMKNAYKNLGGVQNGEEAMNAFANLSTLSPEEKAITRKGLKEYCKLDTLSMLEILKHLESID